MIYLLSGKGGVGKSLSAAALALNLTQKKRKVLLVELGGSAFFSIVFDREVSQEPIETPLGFSVALWNGAHCLREYFHHLLKIQRFVDVFFDSRVAQALVDGAPGLKELALTGKLTSGIRRVGPPMPFDDIIVDGFSTGHFKAFLQAPRAMGEAIAVGPMGEQSKAIDRVLRSEAVKYLVVLNPEDLALTEGLELKEFVAREFSQKMITIGNRWWPVSEDAIKNSAFPKAFVEKCAQVLSLQPAVDVVLPQIWNVDNIEKIRHLSESFDGFAT